LAALLLLAGCSSAPKKTEEPKAKEPEKAEAVAGQKAFWQMYISARNWAPDAQILSVQSIQLPEVKAEPGKAGAWQAVFVSPSKQRQKGFTYSVIEAEGNLHKGVFAGLEEAYSQRGQATPFLTAALKTDTTEAYEEAVKVSDEFLKKPGNKDLPVNFLLELNKRHPNATWRVIWGESISTSGYSVFVDASTGKVVDKAR
jgi:hypothetical protein